MNKCVNWKAIKFCLLFPLFYTWLDVVTEDFLLSGPEMYFARTEKLCVPQVIQLVLGR